MTRDFGVLLVAFPHFHVLSDSFRKHTGSMIHKAGAGPEPIPHKTLDVDNLRDAIKFAISPPAKNAATRMADQIRSEVRWFLA